MASPPKAPVKGKRFWDFSKVMDVLQLRKIKKKLKLTEDGSMNTVPQILYGPFLILGVFGSYMF